MKHEDRKCTCASCTFQTILQCLRSIQAEMPNYYDQCLFIHISRCDVPSTHFYPWVKTPLEIVYDYKIKCQKLQCYRDNDRPRTWTAVYKLVDAINCVNTFSYAIYCSEKCMLCRLFLFCFFFTLIIFLTFINFIKPHATCCGDISSVCLSVRQSVNPSVLCFVGANLLIPLHRISKKHCTKLRHIM